MTRKLLLLVLALPLGGLAAPGFADNAALAQRKPGLWEIQYSVGGGSAEDAAKMQEMRQRLAAMPPEQRAQMEQAMKRGGMGMTLGADGTPTMVTRVCLTPQDMADESNLMKGVSKDHACTPQASQRSTTEVHIHAVCKGPDAAFSEIDGRVYDIAPDRYALEMDIKSASRGNTHMAQKARWLGPDCKGAQ